MRKLRKVTKEHAEQLANTNVPADKKNNFLFLKEKEIFEKPYHKILK